MPGPNNELGRVIHTEPVYLAGCRLTVYSDKKTSPNLQCYYDREHLGNQELMQDLKCERKVETKIEAGKTSLEVQIICTPQSQQAFRGARLWKMGKSA